MAWIELLNSCVYFFLILSIVIYVKCTVLKYLLSSEIFRTFVEKWGETSCTKIARNNSNTSSDSYNKEKKSPVGIRFGLSDWELDWSFVGIIEN